jgi:hypothetical protein
MSENSYFKVDTIVYWQQPSGEVVAALVTRGRIVERRGKVGGVSRIDDGPMTVNPDHGRAGENRVAV